MFRFAITILSVMILLALIRSILGLKLLKSADGSKEQQRGISIFLLSLVDILISIIGLAAVSTKAFRPVETLIATWLLLLLMRLVVRK